MAPAEHYRRCTLNNCLRLFHKCTNKRRESRRGKLNHACFLPRLLHLTSKHRELIPEHLWNCDIWPRLYRTRRLQYGCSHATWQRCQIVIFECLTWMKCHKSRHLSFFKRNYFLLVLAPRWSNPKALWHPDIFIMKTNEQECFTHTSPSLLQLGLYHTHGLICISQVSYSFFHFVLSGGRSTQIS